MDIIPTDSTYDFKITNTLTDKTGILGAMNFRALCWKNEMTRLHNTALKKSDIGENYERTTGTDTEETAEQY